MASAIDVDISEGIATITLKGDQPGNPFDEQALLMLGEHLRDVASRKDARVVIITSEGKDFSVGGDIRAFQRMLGVDGAARKIMFGNLVDQAQQIIKTIRTMPQPVIARVHGAAAGFGFSLILACDFAIASKNSVFVTGFSKLGATPDGGMSHHLPLLAGIKKAAELLLLSARIGANEAVAYGLISQVTEAHDLDVTVRSLARRLCATSRGATAGIKKLLNAHLLPQLEQQLILERQLFVGAASQSKDFSEGVAAFLQKRKPIFSQERSTS